MPIPGSSIDVPCSLFSGLNTELSPSDLPEGVSPDNQNVAYLPGSVFTRPGLHREYPVGSFNGQPVNYMKSFVRPDETVINLFLDAAGSLWNEILPASPGILTDIFDGIGSGNLTAQSVTGFGSEWIAASDGLHGQHPPLRYDGTQPPVRVTIGGPAVSPTAVDSATAGSISAGIHQVCVFWLTSSGYTSKPSPPLSWTAAGGKKVSLTNIPTGPANVVARVIAFTGAGGANFFYIPATVGSVVSTVINDNSTTSATLDFSDNALFAAIAIDIPGNNLFAQVTLGPCLGFATYASRLIAWGEYNKVQNFLNMNFDGGGPNTGNPLGWTVPGAGGSLQGSSTPWFGAKVWDIVGDGSANPRGQIQQGAFQDYLGIAILQPSTFYSFRCWVKNPSSLSSCSLVADLFSPGTSTVYATATISVTPLTKMGNGRFASADFNSLTPAVIPSDLVLRIYALNLANGSHIQICENELYPTDEPFTDDLARVSYVDAPEQFDGVTGVIGSADDPSPIRDFFKIRDTLYELTADRLHATQDNGTTEPSGWTFRQLADKCGSFGVHSSSGGEDWRVWAGPTGLRIFEGQYPWKCSQEIQSVWNNINPSQVSNVWVENDAVNRRVYIGAGTAIQFQSVPAILVLDYRELDTAYDIGKGDPIHISFTGKMIASDRARKWSAWRFGTGNAFNCGTQIYRYVPSVPAMVKQMFFGPDGALGNVYYLDPAKLTDDDYGQITSWYTSYFFINHEAELQLGVGSHRKLYTYLSAFVSGTGNISVTPLGASLTNPWPTSPAYPLSATPGNDLEWPINVTAERAAFKFQSSPLTGQTDNGFNLQKMVVKLREDPWMPVRGAI